LYFTCKTGNYLIAGELGVFLESEKMD